VSEAHRERKLIELIRTSLGPLPLGIELPLEAATQRPLWGDQTVEKADQLFHSGMRAGRSLKIGLGELPPTACFLQVRLFELDRDLTRAVHARPNDGGLAAQMGNCSDISFTTQHYPTNVVAC
jgi:hypothetical protein